MKNFILSAFLILSATTARAQYINDPNWRCISQLFIFSETQFAFRTFNCDFDNITPANEIPSSGWYYVNVDDLGVTLYNQIFAQMLMALEQKLQTKITLSGTSLRQLAVHSRAW